MLTTIQLPRGFRVEGYHNNLQFSQPCFGKIALIADLTGQALHLEGRFDSKFLELITPGTTDDENLTAVRDATFKMNDQHLLYHAQIVNSSSLPNRCGVGGASLYFNGSRIFIMGPSSDFGAIPERTLRLCLSNCPYPIVIGNDMGRSEIPLASKGLDKLRMALSTQAA